MLPACLFSLPLHLWLMKDDTGGGGQRREFRSSAILVLVWGLQTALSQLSGCFWSGQSCCPCPAISPVPSPHHVYTHTSGDGAARPDCRSSSGTSGSICGWAWIFYSLEAHLAVNFLESILERGRCSPVIQVPESIRVSTYMSLFPTFPVNPGPSWLLLGLAKPCSHLQARCPGAQT